MLDLILTGGLVVVPSGPAHLAVGVKSGKIVSLTDAVDSQQLAVRTLAVDGMVIVPGGIDPHIHCNMEVADPNGGRSTYTEGPDVVSRAALYGGTTTLIDFAWNSPGETIATTLDKRLRDWQSSSYTDYSFHVVLRGEIGDALLEEVPQVIREGFASFKIFTSDVTPGESGTKVPFGSIWELFRVTAANNGVVAVHAEDDDLVMHMYRKFIQEGTVGFEHMSEVHNALSEGLSFRRVIALAKDVPGTVVYMMHVSAESGVQAIAEGRSQGVAVYGETLHQYALHTDADYHEADGMKYHTYPSLKSSDDTRALWNGVARGEIATFATDELCTSYAVKTAGRRIDDVTGGNTGVEPRMALIFSEAVQRRGMSLNLFVDVTSANAAKIMGLYPRKGVIAVGSDADLTVVDPHRALTITASLLHESDYTPWEGWQVGAWPVATIKGGVVIVERGQFATAPPRGQLVPRSVLGDVRRGIL
jgi:dihydropyrimidinase